MTPTETSLVGKKYTILNKYFGKDWRYIFVVKDNGDSVVVQTTKHQKTITKIYLNEHYDERKPAPPKQVKPRWKSFDRPVYQSAKTHVPYNRVHRSEDDENPYD